MLERHHTIQVSWKFFQENPHVLLIFFPYFSDQYWVCAFIVILLLTTLLPLLTETSNSHMLNRCLSLTDSLSWILVPFTEVASITSLPCWLWLPWVAQARVGMYHSSYPNHYTQWQVQILRKGCVQSMRQNIMAEAPWPPQELQTSCKKCVFIFCWYTWLHCFKLTLKVSAWFLVRKCLLEYWYHGMLELFVGNCYL